MSRPDEAAMGAAAAPDKPLADENSGLHEIKALASTTRRRISQKITSETEAEESLLVGATSGSFRAAAARPDPAREKAERPADVRPIARPASEVERQVPARSSSAPFWLLGGVATAAAAAAVAVFVFGVGRTSKEADKAPATDVVARAESPAADQGAVTGAPADVRFAEPPPAQPAAGALTPAESAPAADEKLMAEGDAAGRGGASARPDQHVATSKAEPAREGRKENKETEKKSAPGGKSDGKDLNDVLNDVTGGVQAPAKEDEAAPRKPSKKELDRSDVARAMGAVRSLVMRCRDKEQFEGTVTVKFHVAPSGEVTAAEATGSKAGTPTGNCVAAAVKKAKFPAFDGAPTSFTYPFLLAE